MNNEVVNSDLKVYGKSIMQLKSGQGRNLNNKNKGLSGMMSLHCHSCKRTLLTDSRSKRTENTSINTACSSKLCIHSSHIYNSLLNMERSVFKERLFPATSVRK